MVTGVLPHVQQCCQLCGFPANLGLLFVKLLVFWRLACYLFLGLFYLKFACFYKFMFCRLLFFQILWHFWSFHLLLRAIWVCFCENLLISGLFLLMCLIPAFLFNIPADFSLCWIFLPNPCWACFWVKLPILGFVSKYFVSKYKTLILIFGDSNWRQAEAWNVLLAGAVEVNALAQGALRQFTQWQWIEHPTFQLGGGHLITELLPPHKLLACFCKATWHHWCTVTIERRHFGR